MRWQNVRPGNKESAQLQHVLLPMREGQDDEEQRVCTFGGGMFLLPKGEG